MGAKVNSKRLVIDASVARSAGDEGATFPQSVHCRQFLLGSFRYLPSRNVERRYKTLHIQV